MKATPCGLTCSSPPLPWVALRRGGVLMSRSSVRKHTCEDGGRYCTLSRDGFRRSDIKGKINSRANNTKSVHLETLSSVGLVRFDCGYIMFLC